MPGDDGMLIGMVETHVSGKSIISLGDDRLDGGEIEDL